MGYWKIGITPDHFELKNDSGKTVATVKGLANARRFAKSWEYEQLLKELAELLRRNPIGGFGKYVDKIDKMLGYVPGQTIKEKD